jgi:hypothetical protein
MNKAQKSFLRRLRAGGRSNMYGAIPYLMEAFAIDRDSAFRIVCDWVDQQAALETEREASLRVSPRIRPATLPRRNARSGR